MQNIQANTPQQAVFQEKVLSAFEQSLTEEQRFLQDVMTGKIKLIPHEEIIALRDGNGSYNKSLDV